MTYEQQFLAFVATRLPVLIGVGLLLTAAVRRWRDDRGVGGLLHAAGLSLLVAVVAEAPVVEGITAWGPYTQPLWHWAFPTVHHDSGHWGVHLLFAAAAACGLGAVFLRTEPRPAGETVMQELNWFVLPVARGRGGTDRAGAVVAEDPRRRLGRLGAGGGRGVGGR